MMKDVLKVGAGVLVGFGLALGRDKIKEGISNSFYKKFYGKEANLAEMGDEFEGAPDIISVELEPEPEPEPEPELEQTEEPKKCENCTCSDSGKDA